MPEMNTTPADASGVDFDGSHISLNRQATSPNSEEAEFVGADGSVIVVQEFAESRRAYLYEQTADGSRRMVRELDEAEYSLVE